MACALPNTTTDLFECKVCMESILEKQPRTLHCNHTYCDPCLKKLVKNNIITCPVCRKKTEVNNNDVQMLPINIDLSKMKDALTSAQQEDLSLLCQMLSRHSARPKATNLCKDCITKLCDECADLHKKIPVTKDHILFQIEQDTNETEQCDLHKRQISYVCTECAEFLCLECTFDDKHVDHLDSITDFKEGIQKMRNETLDLEKRCFSRVEYVASCTAKMKEELSEINITHNKVQEVRNQLQQQLNKVNKHLKSISDDEKILEDAFTVYTENEKRLKASMNELKARSELDDVNYLKEVKAVEDKALKCLQEFHHTTIRRKYNKTVLEKEADLPEELVMPLSRSEWTLKPPPWVQCVLKWEINGKQGVKFKEPVQITSLDANRALVVDRGSRIQLTDINGRLRRVYTSKCLDKVYSVEYDSDRHEIYVVSNGNNLFKTTEDGFPVQTEPVKGLKLEPFHILVENDSLIASHEKMDCVVVYTGLKTKLRQQAKIKINKPLYLSEALMNGQKYIIITDFYGSIHVYTDKGIFISKIDQTGSDDGTLLKAKATAVTPSGHILVADHDNHRISEFTLDGTFVKHVLTSKDGITSPYGLAYHEPYLWVTEYAFEVCSVKLFHM